MKLAHGVRMAFALVALDLASTGAVGSCAPERSRSPVNLSQVPMPEGLRGGNVRSYEEVVQMKVRLSPTPARIGQALRYRAVILVEPERKVRFEPPQSGGAFSWSDVRAGRTQQSTWDQWRNGKTYVDSVWLEARLQAFETGVLTVPGPLAHIDPLPNSRQAGMTRLPSVRLVVIPTVTAADSNETLRGIHGPLGAPWWERLPLAALVTAASLIIAWVVVLRKARRRVRKPVRRVVAPALVTLKPRLDPAAEALRALFTLRAKKLPEQQRFGEHALELTAILRRFLEATVTTPRPGDTSGELLERLRASRLPADDLERLEGLLGLWDRVKFARAPLTEVEATKCEEAVEAYVRRVAQARLEAEAAAARAAAARAAATGPHGGAPPQPPAPPRTPPSGSRPRPHAPEAA